MRRLDHVGKSYRGRAGRYCYGSRRAGSGKLGGRVERRLAYDYAFLRRLRYKTTAPAQQSTVLIGVNVQWA